MQWYPFSIVQLHFLWQGTVGEYERRVDWQKVGCLLAQRLDCYFLANRGGLLQYTRQVVLPLLAVYSHGLGYHWYC